MSAIDFQGFANNVFKFNDIAGFEKGNEEQLKQQFLLVLEEFKEMAKGFGYNIQTGCFSCDIDREEILDGAVDVGVTLVGLMQKMQHCGYDVPSACRRVTQNNLTKFPSHESDVVKTVIMYDEQGIKLSVEYNEEHDVYVFKDENGKVRKPIGYSGVDLTGCF